MIHCINKGRNSANIIMSPKGKIIYIHSSRVIKLKISIIFFINNSPRDVFINKTSWDIFDKIHKILFINISPQDLFYVHLTKRCFIYISPWDLFHIYLILRSFSLISHHEIFFDNISPRDLFNISPRDLFQLYLTTRSFIYVSPRDAVSSRTSSYPVYARPNNKIE